MNVFVIIYNATLFIILGLSLLLVARYGSKKQNFLWLYLLVTFGFECSAVINWLQFPAVNTDWIYKSYALFCIVFFGIYYSRIFPKTYRNIVVILTLTALIAFASIADYTVQAFEPGIGVLISVFYILLPLLWYVYALHHNLNQKITENPHFWISSALLFWGSFYVFSIYPAKYLYEKDLSFYTVIININYMVAVVMYVLMAIGLLKFKRQKT
ncbi:MAG: hypothetical protein WCY89_09450 [Flavobacteriaceae bacterium]